MTETRNIGFVYITSAFVHSPLDELIVLIPTAGIVQPSQGPVETCTVRNAQSVKGLEQRRVASE